MQYGQTPDLQETAYGIGEITSRRDFLDAGEEAVSNAYTEHEYVDAVSHFIEAFLEHRGLSSDYEIHMSIGGSMVIRITDTVMKNGKPVKIGTAIPYDTRIHFADLHDLFDDLEEFAAEVRNCQGVPAYKRNRGRSSRSTNYGKQLQLESSGSSKEVVHDIPDYVPYKFVGGGDKKHLVAPCGTELTDEKYRCIEYEGPGRATCRNGNEEIEERWAPDLREVDAWERDQEYRDDAREARVGMGPLEVATET